MSSQFEELWYWENYKINKAEKNKKIFQTLFKVAKNSLKKIIPAQSISSVSLIWLGMLHVPDNVTTEKF